MLTKPLEQLTDPLPIMPLPSRGGHAPFQLTLRTPGSKSLTNRALLLAALANGQSTIRRPLLDADDPARMIQAITSLGATVERSTTGDLQIQGVAGRWNVPQNGTTLDLQNAGTATRFLAASSLLATGPITIDGNARMRQRPIGELANALTHMGARIQYLKKAGCPPIKISPFPDALPKATKIKLPTTASSQFISALLLIGPWLPGGITLCLAGEITSPTYIAMTVGLLDKLGATVRISDDMSIIRVGPHEPTFYTGQSPTPGLPAFEYDIEPDASSATYFWAAAALTPGATTRILDLGPESLQGDILFAELLGRVGATVGRNNGTPPSIGVRGSSDIKPVMADMASMPDAAMTLAAVASFAKGQSILRGLRTLRVKETDRIEALKTELAKVGVNVQTNLLGDEGSISIDPPTSGIDCSPDAPRVEFETYDDHRMAMSLALIGLRRPNTYIKNPACVAKTYPTFWKDLSRLYD